jgi:hypothetical protein
MHEVWYRACHVGRFDPLEAQGHELRPCGKGLFGDS